MAVLARVLTSLANAAEGRVAVATLGAEVAPKPSLCAQRRRRSPSSSALSSVAGPVMLTPFLDQQRAGCGDPHYPQ